MYIQSEASREKFHENKLDYEKKIKIFGVCNFRIFRKSDLYADNILEIMSLLMSI